MSPNWAGCLGVAALAGVMLAAGCAPAPPPPPPPVDVAVGPPDGPPMPPPPRPAHKPAIRVPAVSPGVAMLEPEPQPAPEQTPERAPPAADVSRVQGLDEAAALALLGEPQARSEVPPANLWRYDSGACTLELYFYLDLETGEMRVLHYQITEHDGAQQSDQQCYGQLLGNRQRPAESLGAADSSR